MKTPEYLRATATRRQIELAEQIVEKALKSAEARAEQGFTAGFVEVEDYPTDAVSRARLALTNKGFTIEWLYGVDGAYLKVGFYKTN